MSDKNEAKDNEDEEYEQDYESPQKQVVIEQKEPNQRLISLVREPQKEDRSEKKENDDPEEYNKKAKLISKLKGILHEKIEEGKEIKKEMNKRKQQIKQISEQIDRQMNKSILRHAKPYATVNVHDIFNTPKTKDPKLNELNEELSRVRNETKKIKGEIKGIQIKLTTPVSMMNQQRIHELKAKIKQADTQLRQSNRQKQYLQMEIKLMNNSEIDDMQNNEQEIRTNRQKNSELVADIKEEKTKLYMIEKEDRTLMEKIKFLQQADFYSQVRKQSKHNALDSSQKAQIQSQINSTVRQINEIIQQRNKVQNQRKNILKNINTQNSALQTKNWEIINRLREIDAYLLKHYSSKVKKTKVKKQKLSQMSDSFTRIVQMDQKPIERNDKNIIKTEQQPIQLVEKRKTYEFFINPIQKNSIQVSDQFLGTKVMVQTISFVMDQQFLYGFHCEYLNELRKLTNGYKVLPKIRPKDAVTQSLKLEKGELVNFMQIGHNSIGYIKYIQIITSQGKQFKWGKLQNCDKNEQKNIRKYESIVMKGKLTQIADKDGPNYYCLGGMAASVIYLSQK